MLDSPLPCTGFKLTTSKLRLDVTVSGDLTPLFINTYLKVMYFEK